MGIAQEHQLPTKATPKQEWSVRRLFPFADVTKAFAKTFINVFDVLLGFALFFIGFGELFSREVSWLFYILTAALLGCSFFERRTIDQDTQSKK